jgi:hypothetical protein
MKKILTLIAVLAILFPVSAMAGMTAITDSEMSDVTGQVGIDISVVDFSMDMSIANISWGDGDSGTLVASNRDVAYTPGYFNIQGIDMYIYVTLDGSPVFTAAPGSLALVGVKYGIASITPSYFVAAQPFGIDILTAQLPLTTPTKPHGVKPVSCSAFLTCTSRSMSSGLRVST